ncbi:EamA family transporter [Rhodovulum sulfidophilum]|uniref:EamA family transporter n=1 Tax=Rhodovulum sulfidophilum TaxID=35806 RepID=A0ABS1RX72_RHOSU|nr:EamA family transporter [Rhodovulum sulfidophilum]MBL3610697.1 EamA family transporter [Rhodovulum sulfidophilum]MCE8457564.1 EamA family transporter [Rhodovulum sulfidophilum]
MPRPLDLLLTALAPTVWGSTYIVTTELLPEGYPITAAMLRALPAGLLLLLLVRSLPHGRWILRALVLGSLNFSLFWWLLFVSAYRLPGGVAATVGAVQPLIVLVLARQMMGQPITGNGLIASIVGVVGVGLLVLTPEATLDTMGIVAALGGATSMALGTVLTKAWQPPVSPLTFTAWQLTAGGLLLLPAAFLFEPPLPPLSASNVAGFVYLGLLGGAITYILWFRGIALLGPSAVSPLGRLSPVAAVLLGWVILNQTLSPLQIVGMVLALASAWFGQKGERTPTLVAQPAQQTQGTPDSAERAVTACASLRSRLRP